ncbi:MAG: sulfite exporter TauE/SafE family protein [Bacteroidetes bacterium]|nr:MAG: sulfite exporter TauE/SafE family protein [Bacteroidota bacterium]
MTLLTIILGAFLLGFAGSVHCVGMCGPIGLLVPVMPGAEWKRVFSVVLYLVGKAATYATMGLFFGLFGAALNWAGLQQVLSVGSGIILLILVLVLVKKSSVFHQNAATNFISQTVVARLTKYVQTPTPFTPFFMGLINGLLPCGLVYMGLTAALATGHALHATLFMFVFGMGTMPLLLGFVLMAKQFGHHFKQRLQRLTPVLLSFMAVLLILRGLPFEIPFISPHQLGIGVGTQSAAAACMP